MDRERFIRWYIRIIKWLRPVERILVIVGKYLDLQIIIKLLSLMLMVITAVILETTSNQNLCNTKKCKSPVGIIANGEILPKIPIASGEQTLTCDNKFSIYKNGIATGGVTDKIYCNAMMDSNSCAMTSEGCCEIETTHLYTCVKDKCRNMPNPGIDVDSKTPSNGFYAPQIYATPYDENAEVTHACITGYCGEIKTQCKLESHSQLWNWSGICNEKNVNPQQV